MAAGHRRSRRAACLTAASMAPGSEGGSLGSAAVLKRQLSLPVSTHFTGASPVCFIGCSIPTEAAWRHDCLKLAEIEFADRTQCFGGCGMLKVVRQALQPRGIPSPKGREFGDGVVPTGGGASTIIAGGR